MKTFRARAVVNADGQMTLSAPPGVPPGEVEVVVSLPGDETRAGDEPERDAVVVIETNIDDLNPEVYGYLVDRLLACGAKDACLTPIIMKKGRPGVTVSVLAEEADADRLSDLLLAETTTLGVRLHRAERRKLPRCSATVKTAYGPVRVKVAGGARGGRAAPEYEDCARIATERGTPILEVYAAAQRAWEEQSKA